MRVTITADGEHLDAAGLPDPRLYMVVDHHGLLVDLVPLGGPLIDPTIRLVEWGPTNDGATMRDGGVIVRRDGSRQAFWDAKVLAPYLEAYEKAKTAA